MPSTVTKPTGIRLTVRQLAALKHLPKSISVSILVRALVDAYLDGELPHIQLNVVREMLRTESAEESTHFHKGDEE